MIMQSGAGLDDRCRYTEIMHNNQDLIFSILVKILVDIEARGDYYILIITHECE